MAPPNSEIICKYFKWWIAHIPDAHKFEKPDNNKSAGHVKQRNVDIVLLSVHRYSLKKKSKKWHYINEKLNIHVDQQFS